MADTTQKAAQAAKTVFCTTTTFALNTARRLKILGRYSLACWQQQKINKAIQQLGAQTLKALEQGEANPLMAPEVNDALQRAKELKERKEQNYQAIAAIRERIKGSGVAATPDQPGGIEEDPEVP